MKEIHPSAVIDRRAELDSNVQVGPGAVIGAHVRIGPETVVGPYAVIEGTTTIGAGNRIFQFASVGADPQDLKYQGEASRLEIGDYNRIREFTTIHRGTAGGGMVTRIGNHVLLMNYSHIAHDCQIGDHAIIANSTEIAGHCVLEEWVVTAGMCGVHQFSRIGAHSFIAAGSKISQDVPPYAMVAGDRARVVGVNTTGLERRGFDLEIITAIKSAFRTLFYGRLRRDEAIRQILDEYGHLPEVRRLVEFIRISERGVVGRDR
ncbi:MAG: acyl-ACP--UDP-N-acetylglucosamine O-acyltransferase [Deltaproteobacteria bacterium]|nr:acyl-ACP--UDP-N-acetylglucosamine O-acyltransferase [Deltaproteobacteria bacterium]MBV8454598.1 acyl-ACP--UDP-N-acetylglucosamine O-acyltransferase [Deltaproteobacteria bacterium]